MYTNDPTSLLRFNQVKLYSDREISHTTATLLQPYFLNPFFFQAPLAGRLGLEHFDESRLTLYVTQLEAAGFDCHIHAIGDRGVNQALNAIESASTANNGLFQPRHRLTHVSLVQPSDIPRFVDLGVIADFQPVGPALFDFYYSIYLLPIIIQTESEPVRSLYDTGARIVLSSD